MTATSATADYRDRVAAALGDGARFAGLYATDDGRLVRTLLISSGAIEVVTVEAVDGAVPSIVDLAPAAGWDEREAHDLYGVGFRGHDPLRPLVNHETATSAWTVPVRGHDAYEVAVGPIHAGVIESGHFRFHVVGERILHLDAQLFYKHRGLQGAAQSAPLADGLRYVARTCMACSVSNTVAFALACEQALGLPAAAERARVRTVLLELERVWSHLNDIGAVCAGVGLAAGTAYFTALTERARRLNHALTGHRFLAGAVHVGESRLTWTDGDVTRATEELAAIRALAESGWRELAFNPSFQDRLPDIGIVDATAAAALGAVGPAARAAGLPDDARTSAPQLAYADFAPVVVDRAVGDVQARLEQRALELRQSFELLDELLTAPVNPVASVAPGRRGRPIGVGVVESPRGRTVCVVERAGRRIGRLHLRTGSYANWPSVAHAATGNLLPDFPLINKSFELCYACADR
jgi:Ni,Fe-hydrogenase III large subunit